jgi:GNAT superfamily N-acetyltransferase
MTYSIRKIAPTDTYPVRHIVLRFGKPIESCHFNGDDLPTTHHFGYYLNETLVGVISLFEIGNAHFSKQKSYQIRGMAVLDSHQKQGIGEALVQKAEAFCLAQNATLIWFNARTSAVGFYEKMRYAKVGTEFEIKDVGPHYLMHKTVTKN